MSTEIRFVDGSIDVRATVDAEATELVIRLDDKGETDRMYASLSGTPDEIRGTLARLLAITNAVARSLDELTAAEREAAAVTA